MRTGWIGWLCAGAALLMVGGRPGAGKAQEIPPDAPRYRVTDLGTLGGDESDAVAINDRGQIVGASKLFFSMRKYHACLWEQGRKIDLGLLSGEPRETESWANAINAGGTIVGVKSVQLDNDLFHPKMEDHAVLWEHGKMLLLGGHALSETLIPNTINAAGTIAGIGAYKGHAVAFIYAGGRLTWLEGMKEARGINTAGQVVGTTGTDACLWEHGKLVMLGMHGAASVINDRGEIAGTGAMTSGLPHAFLWRSGSATDLGALGGVQSYALGLNQAGQVVGQAEFSRTGDTQRTHAFLYTGGKMLDLNTLVPPNSGWNLISAKAINDKGLIVGRGRIRGEEHAFLLTPVS